MTTPGFTPLSDRDLDLIEAWWDPDGTKDNPTSEFQMVVMKGRKDIGPLLAEVRAGRRLREVASHRGTAGHEDNCAINLERKCDCWVLKLDIAVACYPAPQTEKEKP